MKKYIVFFLFFFCHQFCTAQAFSRGEAMEKMLSELIVPATLDHHVMAFITKTPLQAGDVIEPFLYGKKKTISKPTWFVWINDHPMAFFAHKTRYVFIDAETGKYELSIEEWWPTLNGENLFMSDKEREDLDLLIYSDLHQANQNRNE